VLFRALTDRSFDQFSAVSHTGISGGFWINSLQNLLEYRPRLFTDCHTIQLYDPNDVSLIFMAAEMRLQQLLDQCCLAGTRGTGYVQACRYG
jgi:hypothetical protein